MASMSVFPERYINRRQMLDLGWDQVACRKCSEHVWWLWRIGDDPSTADVVFVCKNCGHLSPMGRLTLYEPMVTLPDGYR